MNAIAEDNPTLDDVLLFNDYLLKLSHAGVPIELDGTGAKEDLLERLSKINSCFAMGIARGNSVRQILESNQQLPPEYRSSLSTWLFCDQSPDAFKALSDCAISRRALQKLVGYSMLQPMLLFVLVYLGFLFMLWFLAPKINALAQQIHATPGWGLWFLNSATQTMWLWAVLVPLLITAGILIWRQQRSHWGYLWVPGRRVIADSIFKANRADSMANLIAHDFTVEQARNASVPPVSKLDRAQPLLQWAVGSDVASEERVNALKASAQTYRKLAQLRSSRLVAWFPIFFGAIFGGGLVLFYGLSLFAPMVELLISLTQPNR